MPQNLPKKQTEVRHFSKTAGEGTVSMPRPHHYLFAHRLVPAMFFADPEKFMSAIENNGDQLVYYLWDRIRQDMKEEDRLPFDELGSRTVSLENGIQVGVIFLPEPKEMSEAFMVAAVFQPAEEEKDEIIRYFTLERGITVRGKIGTILGEWQAGNNHLNYGDGPEPKVEAFVEGIKGKLSS